MTTEWNADVYHRVSDPQFAWGMKVLGRIELSGDETVVDAGCGSGRVAAALAARVPRGRVIGLDRSRQMAAAARATARQHQAPNLLVAVADLSAMPVTGHADLVFSTATFHWILDHPALFREVHGALVPGGRLVAQCGGAGNLARVHEHALHLQHEEPWAGSFAGWQPPWEFASAETTTGRLAAAGFVDVEAWLEPAPTRFDDREAFAIFVATAVLRTHLACLPSDGLRARFLERFTARCAGHPDGLTLDYVRLNLSARRPVRPGVTRP